MIGKRKVFPKFAVQIQLSMEILHRYYYHKGKVIAKAVAYTLLSVLLVSFGVYSYVHWELSFLFSDWKGYVIMGVYGLITLGTILSTIDLFRKVGKACRAIPAFAVGADGFVTYDQAGLETSIPFEDCERVRFKRTIRYRGALPMLTLIIHYHTKAEPDATSSVEFDLSEFDQPQKEVDKQLNKVYKLYKKAHEA